MNEPTFLIAIVAAVLGWLTGETLDRKSLKIIGLAAIIVLLIATGNDRP